MHERENYAEGKMAEHPRRRFAMMIRNTIRNEVKFATRREKEKRKGKDFENGGGRRKKSGKMEGGELIRIGLDSKSRWWKTFWPRAFHHRTLASRGNSRGKMAPTQRDTENA